MITLEALAQLYADHGAELERPVAPVRVSDDVTVGDGHVTIMGTVNLSRDSTYRESVAVSTASAVRKARTQVAQGATIVDVGAEASGSDAERRGPDEQLDLLLPVVEQLADEVAVSVETYEPAVVKSVLAAGARMINLTGTEHEEEMLRLVAEHDASVLMCFSQGDNVRDAEDLPADADLVPVLLDHFGPRLERARSLGVDRVVIDPGMGFSFPNLSGVAKAKVQLRVLVQALRLRELGVPAGHALPHAFDLFEDEFRKAEGFFAVFAALGGAHLLRVHEVPHIRTVLGAMDALAVR
ncbi:dihydropteroate synthase [Nocardioides coralli]|uniref:dihydropteroate synthase n=1 Tax=Nocardioides coralli TaxID=2872154 RepID=UPI001CA40251|nr:dihydropteroate synthase [Nocardioides coralli]QZY28757.1 dihydropteroate synthase [Nocardioides coralli]